MKVLLDECIDHRFAKELPGHSVETVPRMGWAGLKNGDILKLAENGFDVFITVGRNLSFQQNLPQFNLAVLVLLAPTNRLADLKLLIPDILAALPSAKVGQVLKIGI